MARYKQSDAAAGQGLFLTVRLEEQLIPGSFEYMLNELLDRHIDISVFDRKYKNDTTGASAIPPKALLKLIIYGYSKGMNSSRELHRLSRENMVAKALTGDIEMHYTTIADFISSGSEELAVVFTKVLGYCHEMGLIGGKAFAIDGCRLPSNASQALSGTKAQLIKRLAVFRRMAENHIAKHRRKDALGESDAETKERAEKRQAKLNRQIETLSHFIDTMEVRTGSKGQELQSNVTDNESGVIKSSKGYVQGYIGLAVADSREQIIVKAAAVGGTNEGKHLPMMLAGSEQNLEAAGAGTFREREQTPVLLADKAYFSEENLQACAQQGVEGIIADSQERRRMNDAGEKIYAVNDFTYHEEGDWYECPEGKKLCYQGTRTIDRGKRKVYSADIHDCRGCRSEGRCIKRKKGKKEKKVSYTGRRLLIREGDTGKSYCDAMREKWKHIEYKEQYDYRIQVIEPVFANIVSSKGLDRFTVRGQAKVTGQWQLYCMVHNLGKCLKAFNKGLA
jgi:transposase/IS5 family transposase